MPVNAPSVGFAPIEDPNATVLVLGSLPGQRSLREQQYYAHPQNSFWRIMQKLIGAEGPYEERCNSLIVNGIALWDVLEASVRPGSMDADIRTETASGNDFAGFFAAHPKLELVCFNGQKAAELYRRLIGPDATGRLLDFETLPSTSPAYAAMRYEQKLARWSAVLGSVLDL